MKNIKATNFIVSALKGFIKSFPETRVRYEFDVDAEVHCIEVIPKHIYHSDDNYIEWENMFTNDFLELFPDQNICFFSDDSIVGINKIDFEFLGTRFRDINSINARFTIFNTSTNFIFNNSSLLNFENISSTTKVFNEIITNEIKHSNLGIESANSILPKEISNQSLFVDNYSMVA